MTLDPSTVAVVTAVVVNVSGTLFIVETLTRRDEGAGRIWSLAFLSEMLATVSYSMRTGNPEVWWPVVVGHAATAAAAGIIWLGCRAFNERSIAAPGAAVAAAALAVGAGAAVAGPEAGEWAGALWLFGAIVVFSGLGMAESLRALMGRIRTAWTLSAVLGFEGLFTLARTSAFVASGPDSSTFATWFGGIPANLVMIVVIIAAVVVTSVLRAGRTPLRGYAELSGADSLAGGILSERVFLAAWRGLCERAAERGELAGVVAVRIEDLDEISIAFGSEVAGSITEVWRAGVRRHAPASALVGDDGPTGLLVGVVAESPAAARRTAVAIYRGLFDGLGSVTGGVLPVVGVGVGLSDSGGYEPETLIRRARDAAHRAATSVETSVLVGDAD